MSPRTTTARHRAREALFRIVYQSDVTGDPIARVWGEHHDRERLSPDENRQLQQLLMTASPEMVAIAEARVANLSADDAVAFLREHVLAAPNAA